MGKRSMEPMAAMNMSATHTEKIRPSRLRPFAAACQPSPKSVRPQAPCPAHNIRLLGPGLSDTTSIYTEASAAGLLEV
jgi:hypothetical protein